MTLSASFATICKRAGMTAIAIPRGTYRLLFHPAFLLALLVACSSQAERKAQHMTRGEAYLQDGKYREAEIEFRNALQIDPKFAVGHAQLGKTYLALKDPRSAFAEFRRALELDDTLRDPRYEVARLYLAAGDGVKAEAEARTLIERNPKDVDARLILITWLLIDQKVADADEEVKQVIALAPNNPGVELAHARVLAAKGQYDAAEAAMQQAVKLDPTALEAHLTLAAFYRLRQQNDKAETALKGAISAAPTDAAPRFQLAELYLLQRRYPDVLTLLEQMVKEGPEKDAAKRRLVDLYLEMNRVDDAERGVTELEAVDKGNLETRYLRARIRLARGDIPGGSRELEEVLKEWPSFIQARYQLAVARVRENKLEQAAAELAECLKYRGDFVEARSLLAQLHLNDRRFDLAAEEAKRVLAIAPNYTMLILLSDAAIGSGDYQTARTAAQQAIDYFPQRAGGYQRMARVLSDQNQTTEALKFLDKAFEIEPTSLEVMRDVVVVMGKEGLPASDRINRVRVQSEAHPENAPLKLMLAHLQLEENSPDGIPTLEAVIKQDPKLLAAYYLLGAAYAKQGRLDDARRYFEHVLEKDPAMVSGYMMIGIIDEIQGKYPAAAARYKQALDLDPNFAPAANNLAWHYAEREKNLDVALELARRAKQLLPDDPNVADTLGWVLYRRGLYAAAIEHLKFSAEKQPQKAEARYHLGMAYLRNGDSVRAKAELTAALNIGEFSGKEEAERALKEVG
jgi:tetratricopeptide (TPR) repeat protein